jgi:alkylation response protein AidB-like acyl-CoA dehydrogenase
VDFEFSPAQRRWHDAAAEFGRTELADPRLHDRDLRAEFWREGYERCARLGLAGLPVPTEYGGQGENLETAVAAMEGLGLGCEDSGLIFALNAALWTVTLPILEYGTDDQKRRYLPDLCSGGLIGANCVSEPDAGSDVFAMQTTARRDGDDWVLSGGKTWITAGPVADLFLCFAVTDRSRAAMGLSAFLVDARAAGVRVVREIPKLGMRTVPMGQIAFDECRLPASSLLGREGRGGQIFHQALEWERGAILAFSLGVMKRRIDQVLAHARQRRQFGQPIGKFQSVSNRIVDMALRLETSRLLVYRYAWARSRGQDAALPASMAKLHVSECFAQNSLDAVRLLGAGGYAVEGGVERDLRDSVGGLIFSGTNDIQRVIIARRLGIG